MSALLAPRYLAWLWQGLLTTLWSALLVIVASTLLGLGLAGAREFGGPVWRTASRLYLSVFRNTPLLVQLFFWYFGLPALLPPGVLPWLNTPHELALGSVTLLRWPSFEMLAALVGLVAYSTAYVGEDIRSGLRGVPAGQRLAALALGFTPLQVLRQVVFPQALRLAATPLIGQFMNILKNTSLAMAIGLVELSYRTRQVEAETWKTFQVYGVSTLLYVAAIAGLAVLGQAWQRHLTRHLR
ncbi:amino acid ABC transporter permease [Comamonas serinivorans]|uniref:amino acid ABC transporter permease n=1 Tax=Comamonas serinivorans TaxID=1082851 RepID=UPI00196A66BB|nr:amino acid ABC transporter permease [Comamonas serinivorans]